MKKLFTILLSLAMLTTSLLSFSLVAEAATLKAPEVSITIQSSTKVKISWSKVKKAKKYEVYRSTKSNSGYKRIKTTTKTAFTNSNLKKGRTYYYKVRAVNGSKKSKYSVVVTNWGKITGVDVNSYGIIDGYSWEDEAWGGFVGYTMKFNKVKSASGYQAKIQFPFDDSYSYKNITGNKWYYGTQEGHPNMKIRAYKTVNNKRVYGPWKTILDYSDDYRNYDESYYIDEWEEITDGYKDIFSSIYC